MSFRNFVLILSVTFGLAWLAIIIVPYMKMRSIESLKMDEDSAGSTNAVYIPKRAGRIADGSQVYAENGCYMCHSQLVRPTYAGNDLFRPDWAGMVYRDKEGDFVRDSRRESNVFDYNGEKFAHLGVARIGPDLSNIGTRVIETYAKGKSAEAWLFQHLYNPQHDPDNRESICAPVRYLFSEKKVVGNPSNEALPFDVKEGYEIVPRADAKALVSYLLSMKKDQPVPAALNYGAPVKEAAAP